MIWLGILLTIIFLLVAIAYPEKKDSMSKWIKGTWIVIGALFGVALLLVLLAILISI